MANQSSLEEIERIVSPENITTSDLGSYAVDGVLPKAVVVPKDIDQLCSVLSAAEGGKLSVVPRGGGTKMGLGNVPERVDLVISLSHLDQVVEYEPADLTITVQAGIKLADLQMVLGEWGQFLPLDPPFTNKATIGGIIAANSSGPLRCRYGPIRDMLIGMKAAKPDGSIIKGGGRVVKNVAGYDLNKLFIGSLGTLGVITEVTLKLQPLPETKRELVAFFPSIHEMRESSSAILDSQLELAVFELFNRSASQHTLKGLDMEADDCPYSLFVGIDGPSEAVSWQLRQLGGILSANGAASIRIPDEGEGSRYREQTQGLIPIMLSVPGSTSCKVSVLMSETIEVCKISEEAGDRFGLITTFAGRPANGIIHVCFNPQTSHPQAVDGLSAAISEVRNMVSKLGGYTVVEWAPPEVKKMVDVWGEPGDDLDIMRDIKRTMDPHSILNPGRFLGGI